MNAKEPMIRSIYRFHVYYHIRRWIMEKSDGLTKVGLQKLSQTVRDYVYLILTSQTSTRGQIVGHTA